MPQGCMISLAVALYSRVKRRLKINTTVCFSTKNLESS